MSHAVIKFKFDCDTSDYLENYIQQIEGTIYSALQENEEYDAICGDIQLLYIDISSAIDDGVCLNQLFDTTQLTDDYCTPLYDTENNCWNETVTEEDEDIIDHNILIIHRVRILPKFRGRGIGKLAIRRSIQQFCHGCGLVILHAKPYQIELRNKEDANLKSSTELEGKYALNKLEADEKKAYQKLEAYYDELGFDKLEGTKFMTLNPRAVMPTMVKLRGYSDESFV